MLENIRYKFQEGIGQRLTKIDKYSQAGKTCLQNIINSLTELDKKRLARSLSNYENFDAESNLDDKIKMAEIFNGVKKLQNLAEVIARYSKQ